MRILLITNVYDSEVVGPARFAKLLQKSKIFDVDILTINSTSEKVINIPRTYPFPKNKLTQYFDIGLFQEKIKQIEGNYDFLLFNNALIAHHIDTSIPYAVMVNDAKLIDNRLRPKFDYLRRLIFKNIEKKVITQSPRVIVNSGFLKERLVKAYRVSPSKVSVLLKGISFADKEKEFQHAELSEKNIIKVLFVKNDYVIGGLKYLIESLISLPHYQFELSIAGTSDKVMQILKPAKNISYTVHGYCTNKKIIEMMYDHDLLSIPALKEPLGVAVMEGLAVGIPVITTGVGGLPVVTDHGRLVWQAKPGDVDSLSRQIVSCIELSQNRIAKSKEGRAYVRSKFDFSIVEKNLMDIIKNTG